ncbi:Os04g0562650, partial [Oryza sativa Japonica Group]
MLSKETRVLTRARNTFSPLLSTLAMHRSKFSWRSNAALRAFSSGFMRDSDRSCTVDDSPSSPPPSFCFLAERRLARDIQRTRSATHHMRWWLVLGSSDEAVSLAGAVTQHGVEATSTRAAAAELEREERPEKTAAEPDATAIVASATAAAMAAVSAGRSSGSCAGDLLTTARAAAARRGRSRPARRCARAADASRAGSPRRSAARVSAWSAESPTSASRKLPCASARRRKSSSSRSANVDRPSLRSGSCACGWCSSSESDTSTLPTCDAAAETDDADGAAGGDWPITRRSAATSSSSCTTSGWKRQGR